MEWKTKYWVYVGIAILVVAGVVLGVIYGTKGSDSVEPVPASQEGESRETSPGASDPPATRVQGHSVVNKPTGRATGKKVRNHLHDDRAHRNNMLTENLGGPPGRHESGEKAEDWSSRKTWYVSGEIEMPVSKSKSFGFSMASLTSLTHASDWLLVGAPSDQTYGKVYVFQPDRDAESSVDEGNLSGGFHLMKDFGFSVVGSAHQKAGYMIDGDLVAAPDFTVRSDAKSRSHEGALFRLTDLDNPDQMSVKRLKVDRGDGFTMVKFGQVFRYRPPWVLVTKRKQRQQKVEVFRFNPEDHDLIWSQTLTPPPPRNKNTQEKEEEGKEEEEEEEEDSENHFGHGLSVSADGSSVVISDPCSNQVFVFERRHLSPTDTGRFELVQSVDFTPQYKDKHDFHQAISLSDDGLTLLVSSPDNNMITVMQRFNTKDSFETRQVMLNPPDGVGGSEATGFGMGLAMHASGLSLAVSGDPKDKKVFLYGREDLQSEFRLCQEFQLQEFFPHTWMNPQMIWSKGHDLYLAGLSNGKHPGKVMWLTTSKDQVAR